MIGERRCRRIRKEIREEDDDKDDEGEKKGGERWEIRGCIERKVRNGREKEKWKKD